MTEKRITYWRVNLMPDDTIARESLDEQPAHKEALYGEIKVENDDQILLIFTVDEGVHERILRASRDAAALVREWEIPHIPVTDV